MKQTLLITLTMLLSVAAASAQKRMIVHLKDGQTVTYEMSKVDYVELEGASDSGSESAGAASVLDMGTRARWATCNVGATTMSGVGKRLTFDEALSAAKEWGDGWRLPNEEELQELYETCTWEWTTIDGVGGRMLTAKNGNKLFLPACGLQLEKQLHVVGALGIYWTSVTSSSNSKSAVGAYFDSANIYRMEFPKENTFSVRLVKE